MHRQVDQIRTQLNQIILGKARQVELAIICLLAKGHLLIEDLPGMGKTTLAHGLARVFGLEFQRIQFTSDLLPSDITGGAIYERASESFIFHPGPIFSQVILADEINRATPKTQSALLEAMEENQVTVEGQTRLLPTPFFVIATQNPSHQIGTYPLPESQLDRFLIRLSLGYPPAEVESQLLMQGGKRESTAFVEAQVSVDELLQMQKVVAELTVNETIIDYVMQLILATRQSPELIHGLSPRAGLAVIHAAKACAWLSTRDFVIPEDVQSIFEAVVSHRLQAKPQNQLTGAQVAQGILQQISAPV